MKGGGVEQGWVIKPKNYNRFGEECTALNDKKKVFGPELTIFDRGGRNRMEGIGLGATVEKSPSLTDRDNAPGMSREFLLGLLTAREGVEKTRPA